MAVAAFIWFALRQPETLSEERRIRFSPARLGAALGEILRNRIAFGYTLGAGLVFGAFLGYLNSAQQIFQVQYGLGRLFPVYFAIVALALGTASVSNSKLVMRHGMQRLARRSLVAVVGLSTVFWLLAYSWSGHPPLWTLMLYLLTCFFSIGILFGNLNARAMEPLGHIAGTGAAVVGSAQTVISLILGVVIGQSYNGTILPLVGGFAVLGIAAFGVVAWAERGRETGASPHAETDAPAPEAAAVSGKGLGD
jgi:DHA1 family bicyclomycin/chloramphenicol resistance-like MFS transporter